MRQVVVTLALFTLACSEVTITTDHNDNGRGDPPDIDDPRPEDEFPPVAACGVDPRQAVIGEPVDLIGEYSHDPDDFPILAWYWRIVSAPFGSQARLPRGGANIEGFLPDVLGEYTFSLVVTDEAGKQSEPCATTLDVISEDGLYIELIKPGHAKDTTLAIKPKSGEVCGVAPGLCDVSWGPKGRVDDPVATEVHDHLDTVAVAQPAADTYDIGVYLPYTFGSGVRDVTLVIWLSGREATRMPVRIDGSKVNPETGSLFPIARVILPAGTVQGLIE